MKWLLFDSTGAVVVVIVVVGFFPIYQAGRQAGIIIIIDSAGFFLPTAHAYR